MAIRHWIGGINALIGASNLVRRAYNSYQQTPKMVRRYIRPLRFRLKRKRRYQRKYQYYKRKARLIRKAVRKRRYRKRKRIVQRKQRNRKQYGFHRMRRTATHHTRFHIDDNGDAGATQVAANTSWFDPTDFLFEQKCKMYQSIALKKITWKLHNIKYRVVVYDQKVQISGSGSSRTETVKDRDAQVLEPPTLGLYYRHNKYNDESDPDAAGANDTFHLARNFQKKCITSACRKNEQFWGKINFRGDYFHNHVNNSVYSYLKGTGTGKAINDIYHDTECHPKSTGNSTEGPYLNFWLKPDSPYPSHFFDTDDQTKKRLRVDIFLDYDLTVYSTYRFWKRFNKDPT